MHSWQFTPNDEQHFERKAREPVANVDEEWHSSGYFQIEFTHF